jgi:undecaprenyl-diphosphatase
MNGTRVNAFFDRLERLEAPVCLTLNRICLRRWARALFTGVSRLGDGVFWYTLILALPLVYGREALPTSLRMAAAGLAGVLIYKLLKDRTGRPRPFVLNRGVRLAARPLDRYSFPSGHTLHAVCFTLIVVAEQPPLAWLVVPFALLVALSRVVLGLHYPTDVAAGAVLGALIAWGSGLVWALA